MKKTSIFSLFMALALLMAVPFASANDNKFDDIQNVPWAVDAINELSDKNIINGYGDNKFRPNGEIKRAEAALMIARALELDMENVKALTFKDVSPKHGAYNAIAAVYEAGIMQGYNNQFNPEKSLTRGEMAVLLHNAFNLTATVDVENTFKDVSKDYFAFKQIHYLAANEITNGFPDQTFKPENKTTRAQFAVFLSKALAHQNADSLLTKEELTKLLAEVQENEFALDSYEFTSNAEIGLSFPEMTGEDAELMNELMSMFENIRLTMTGAYVKDPMHIEMMMELIINEEMGLTLEMPFIMTEDAVYMKMEGLFGDSEDDKFIKMDLSQLAEMSPEDAAALDMELQFELSKILNELMTKHLIDFYSEVDLNTIEIEYNTNAKKAIKFEVTNESVESFIQILFEDIMPELLELMQNPKYTAAFGLTAEDLELLVGQDFDLDIESEEFQQVLKELREVLQINELSSHITIDTNNIALDHAMNADVELTLEGETVGLTLNAILQKQKINDNVTFQFGIPTDEETISLDDLEDDYDYDEDYDFEDDYYYDEEYELELE